MPALRAPRGSPSFDEHGWLSIARRIESPNVDSRPAGIAIDLLVIHHISLPPGRLSGDAIERLFTNRFTARDEPSLACLRDLRVSTHFLIRRRGELLQFAGCGQRAWHAGVSRFRNRERCNDFSIGIELEGTGEVPYTDAQYRRLAQLVPLMCTTYPLKWVAGHSDIAPGRKYDPGPSFDWSRIAPVLKASALKRPF